MTMFILTKVKIFPQEINIRTLFKSLLLVFVHYALFFWQYCKMVSLGSGNILAFLWLHFFPFSLFVFFFHKCKGKVWSTNVETKLPITRKTRTNCSPYGVRKEIWPIFSPFLDENNFWPQMRLLFDTFTNHLLNITQRGSLNWFFFCPW